MSVRIFLLLVFAQLFGVGSAAYAATVDSLIAVERTGIRDYERESFADAARNLTTAAEGGMKLSQYMLAFMYLRGQYVQQSLVEGMAWLGVAKESGEKEWVDTYKKIYKTAKPAQRTAIDKRQAQLVILYGMKAQGVSCSRRRELGSNRMAVSCIKKSAVEEELGRLIQQ